MVYEWDAKKAKSNLRKHGISFEEAATAFLDSLAVTFPDPDHSILEEREITIGVSARNRVVFVSHCPRAAGVRIISARRRPRGSRNNMKKAAGKGLMDDLRPEYDLSQLKGGVRGKYYREAVAGTNLVLIEPDLADIFPDSESVNNALRLLVDTADATARRGRRRRGPHKKLQRTAQGRSGRTPQRAGIS